ncbi:MetQ/NlpA family ABC transporter substrate-binding protein [Brevibacillus choshinensis]|uniref:MetQ/NlpA family ABC transporter substrate-binding protein n=1 Tax=Brevibacillus choshinensis TaxID=54911 RepID=UPI002E1E9410|nr:MetQ/NlpA family ABC transporter substrate-binding protein [Brevibacillus choshinensis]MED4753192.1 MetQ/NlpA family ABC transporter substrate-binding protein [Brevibacillus choshinensis]
MKKFAILLIFVILAGLAAGCAKTEESKGLKIGIRGSESRTWEFVKEQAQKQGLNIELVQFNANVNPNTVLLEGDIDANAFQHVAFLDQFNTKNKSEIVPVGSTIIAPLGIYSDKFKKIDEIPDNAKIAVPNDDSNWGRSLVLLQEAGLIKVVDHFDGFGGADKIKENPKNLEIVPVDGATTPRVMKDVAASIINNGVAVEAGFLLKDSIFHESQTAKPYINVIATTKQNENREDLKKLVHVYQSKEVSDFITKTYQGNYIPTQVTVEELKNFKSAYASK